MSIKKFFSPKVITPVKPTPTFLANKNPHPRDASISFEEGPHIYTVMGERGTYTSVTTWNHKHFPKFDQDAILDSIMNNKKKNDPTYKYYNMTRQDILASWCKNRDTAANSGTDMHYDIECFYNEQEVKNDSIEYQYFQEFVRDFPELKAYRTEWMVYYEELKMSGSIDMIFENPDGTLQIYDWKRCQEIVHENAWGKTAITPCIGHLPDTNFWHYTLQLNIYKKILEDKYDKKVTDLYLVCLHPNNWNKTYQRIQVPIIEREIVDLFALRKQEVESGSIKH
jgi:ATP-dependent exoDNAse (exonuclease V) beta subunit